MSRPALYRPALYRPALWSVLLALVVGIGTAFVVATATDAGDAREELYGDPGDRVRTAVDALLADPVHVTPDGRSLLAEDDAAALSALIRERDLPVYVVVWQPSDDAGYTSPIQAGDQLTWALREATGEPAAVVQWGIDTEGRLDTTPGWLWRPDVDYEQTEPEYFGDAAPRLTEWVEALPAGSQPIDPVDDDLSPAGAVTLGLLSALAILATLWGLLWLLTGWLRRRNA